MSHTFARLDDSGLVSEIIVLSDEDCNNEGFPESEQFGINFINNTLSMQGNWKEGSMDGSFRVNRVALGFFYDSQKDAFYSLNPPHNSEPMYFDEITLTWVPLLD